MKKVKIETVNPNPKNPRVISEEMLDKLKKSITEFKEMLEIRPIIVNKDNMILGGNMRYKACEDVMKWAADLHPLKSQPVTKVMWVSLDKVKANDYNPNMVAKKEMMLLYTSIKHDGYTQPIVTIYDKESDKWFC